MPRQDVPYGGAICRLKERIAELFDLVGEKLHSINGVQGDGRGDVKLISGDPAVVITGDAAQNEIEIALDNSKLPSAAVSSVNGETGAVVLDAENIPSHGNSDVQTDIDAGKAAIRACSADIIAEREARQNADAALQTNINAARASIPEISTTPDPYKGIKRDAQGRAFAADPAVGATDKTLVTANWVSQTGNDAPNNLAHRNGNETWSGEKRFLKSPWFDDVIRNRTNYAIADAAGKSKFVLSIFDTNGTLYGGIKISTDANGKTHISVFVYDADGTWHGRDLI